MHKTDNAKFTIGHYYKRKALFSVWIALLQDQNFAGHYGKIPCTACSITQKAANA